MWYGDDDPAATPLHTPQDHPERLALINEIRHLEKSTNDALRTTQDELERLESTSSQTRSEIDHLERKLKVLEMKKQKGHNGNGNSHKNNGNGGGGGGVNKKLNSFLTRSITISGGGEQLEELRSRRSFVRRPSISNLRGSMIGAITNNNHENNDLDTPQHNRRAKPFVGSIQTTISQSNRSSMSRSIGASGHSFSLGVSTHSRLTNLLSGLATHDSGDEESSTSSSFSPQLSSSSCSSSSSSSDSDSGESKTSTQTNSKNKQQQSQINELTSTLQLKKDQLHQLQHDKQTNSSKLSIVQSQLYNVNREYTRMLQDHECKMKVLQDVYNKKWCGGYVNMRSNSVTRAEERLDVWKCRIEELEAEVNGSRKNMSSSSLKSIQEEITRYQVRIKVYECKQKIIDEYLASLEKSQMRLDDCQKQQQQQGEGGRNSDSGCSEGSESECRTGGEAANAEEEEEEDLSYIIGKEEGLSIIHSVEDSDISETASEEEEEEQSALLSTNDKMPAHANTKSPKTTTTRGHLTVLLSGGNFNLSQTANQRSTLQLLVDQSLPHVTIDGMDPAQRERRNALFGISGIRGNYPQIFVTTKKVVMGNGGEEEEEVECSDVYLGGYEWLECCDLDKLKELFMNNSDAEEEVNDEQCHIVNEISVEIDGHLRSLEKAIKIMEGRVKDFDILSTSTVDRQRKGKDDGPSMNAANQLSSLAKECADVLENFTTKTSDIISSSLQLQPSTLSSSDNDTSANAAADEVIANIEEEMITAIEQKKLHLTQLEQSRDACNANIELLKSDIESLELAMEEQNQSNYEVFTEIQTKMGLLTKRLESGSNKIRGLMKEMKDWSSREELLLKAQRSRGISFIR